MGKKTKQVTLNMDEWFFKELDSQVTKAGHRSFNKYVLSILKEKCGYNEKKLNKNYKNKIHGHHRPRTFC